MPCVCVCVCVCWVLGVGCGAWYVCVRVRVCGFGGGMVAGVWEQMHRWCVSGTPLLRGVQDLFGQVSVDFCLNTLLV